MIDEHSTAMIQAQAVIVVILMRSLVALVHIQKQRNTFAKPNSPGVNFRLSRNRGRRTQWNTESGIRRGRGNARYVAGNARRVIVRRSETSLPSSSFRNLTKMSARTTETEAWPWEQPESSTREDRLPRALLSERFVRHRRRAEFVRALRDPTAPLNLLRYAVPRRAYLLSFIILRYAHKTHNTMCACVREKEKERENERPRTCSFRSARADYYTLEHLREQCCSFRLFCSQFASWSITHVGTTYDKIRIQRQFHAAHSWNYRGGGGRETIAIEYFTCF